MKYLNLGCGGHYSVKQEWTNLDFVSRGQEVIGHNLLKGIPFGDNEFDLVYHSHVLEHFSKEDGEKFISECIRVLKAGGTLRIAIPDLERIAREYLKYMEMGVQDPGNNMVKANYDWMLLEMYDQTVRNKTGGNMGKYLFQEKILNEDFVFNRIGEEGRSLRKMFLSSTKKLVETKPHVQQSELWSKIKSLLRDYLLKRYRIDLKAHEIGKFRLGGEIHQWMYDKYSISKLLSDKGMADIQVRDAFTSYIDGWAGYKLDGEGIMVRKPDSLFIEARKR